MPDVDSTYIIGVIREKEKGFLRADNYIRLIEAPTTEKAIQILVDTPYGVWLNGDNKKNVFKALSSHLQEEIFWISDLLEDPAIVRFITARYNALDAVSALSELKSGQESLSDLSPLSSITQEVMFTALWHNHGWDHLPEEWSDWIKQEREGVHEENWKLTDLLQRTENKMWQIMKESARTPLMKEMLALQKEQIRLDKIVRNEEEFSKRADEVTVSLKKYQHFNEESLNKITAQESAVEYEKGWDEEALSIIQKYRLDPIGDDPVIAYWYGKEMEVRHLRILFSAKMGGVEASTLKKLQRSIYTEI